VPASFDTEPDPEENPPREKAAPMDLPEPPRPDQKAYRPAPQAPRTPPPQKSKPSTGFIIAMVVVGFIVLGAIINAFDGDSGGGSTPSDDGSDALTERTCEIARDISQDAADGVDTTTETRDRFKDLLDGYGQSAPADIAVPLRDIVAALTSLDNAALRSAVGQLDSACSSRGF
jgi:hypothetical protein